MAKGYKISNRVINFGNGAGSLFDQYFRDLYSALCRFASTYTKDEELAADLVQDCFLKLWENGTFNNHQEHLSAYLYNTVRNRCIDYLRRLQVQEKRIGEFRNFVGKLSDDEVAELTRAETTRQLHLAIAELPDHLREIVRLHFLEGRKFTEIAKATGIGYDNLRKRAAKAIKLLQTKVKPMLK